MKKLLVIALGAVLAVGCDPVYGDRSSKTAAAKLKCVKYGFVNGIEYTKIILDRHEYLVAEVVCGVSMIHSESCPCKRTVSVAADF